MFKVIDCLGNESNIPKCNPHLWAMKPTDVKVVAEDGTEYINENVDIDACNELISKKREEEYKKNTDSIFFKYIRDELTKKDWTDAVDAIKIKYPKK